MVGEAVVIWLTFGHAYAGHISVGLIALVPNIVVVILGTALARIGVGVPEKLPELAPTGQRAAG